MSDGEIEPYGTTVARKERVLECRYLDSGSNIAAERGVRCKHGAGVARASMRSKVDGDGTSGAPHGRVRRKAGGGRRRDFPRAEKLKDLLA